MSPLGYNSSIAAEDLNGDGKIDVAVATNSYTSVVGVLLGNGDGTFQAQVTYPGGTNATALAVGDFNGDGIVDLAITTSTGVNILLGGALPDLSIVLTHPSSFTRGQIGAWYRIVVSNAGYVSSSGVVGVVDTLPVGLTATAIAGDGWTCVLQTLTCTRSDSLAAGASYPAITVRVNVAGNASGSVTNTATVSDGSEANMANNTASDLTLIRLTSSTSLTSSPNPSLFGQAVTLTATVLGGTAGKVTFYDGAGVLGVATMAGGQAALTTVMMSSGAHSLRAQYDGDASYGPSSSAPRSQTVATAASNGLQPPASYTVGTNLMPALVAVGDFNRDGKADLVTVNGNSANNVSVLLGNGNGTFQTPVNYPVAVSYPRTVVVGDFDGDGKPDLAVSGNNGIYVLLGNGDGTFQAATTVGTVYANEMVAADFDGDGNLDLVVVANGVVTILLGKGDGTFQAPATNPYPGAAVSSDLLAVADLNGDGKPDLVAGGGGFNPVVSVLLGNGDGTFQAALTYTYTTGFYYVDSLTMGDFNGDGKPDVALISWSGIDVLLGNGDGSLQAPIPSTLNYTPAYAALAGDFNGDGKLDLAYGGYSYSQVVIAFGNGDGTFQHGVPYVTDGYGGNLVLADFNGDFRPDLSVANSSGKTVNVFLGGQFSGLGIRATHSGNFTAGQTGATYQITVNNPAFAGTLGVVSVTDTLPSGITATAISGSGWACTLGTLVCTRSDTLANGSSFSPITITVSVSASLGASTVTNQASVLFSGVTNMASDVTSIVLPTTTGLTVSPNPALLGQAVTLTATVTSGTTGKVLFYDSTAVLGVATVANGQAALTTRLLPAGVRSLRATYAGDATHAPSQSTAIAQIVNAGAASGFATVANYSGGAGPWAVAVGDFNGDGTTDLAAANADGNSVSILLGNGNGTFRAKVDYAAGTKPVSIAVGDFNGDGKTDLAVANQTSNNLSVFLGNGNGTFQTAVNYLLPSSPSSVLVGDLNGDGKADLIVGQTGSGFSVLTGNGDGSFQAAVTNLSYSGDYVTAADLNGDGKTDLIVSNYGNLYILLGDGSGTFTGNNFYAGYAGATSLTVADVNGDGKADIIAASSSNNSAVVLLGNGDGTFRTSVSYPAGTSPVSVAVADVNGDGKLDVVTANSGSNNISVLLGRGDGTFQTAVSYAVGTEPRSIAVGDFNGDGRTDLVTANHSSNNVSVLLGILTPVLTVTKTHAGYFILGQTGATYSIRVSNDGPGATSGTVTVVDTLPSGLTATAIGGTGWSCVLGTLTCTRSDSLASVTSYPAITVTVNVAANAASPQVNTVAVSGGGSPNANAVDSAIIYATNPAALSITLTHVGNFTAGQVGATYTVNVSNGAAAGSTSGTVTVTETVPSGLTLVSMAGTNWTCASNTCTRSDVLTPGSSYPAITVTVNVAANAPSQVTNQVSVSGGGPASPSASDITNITSITSGVAGDFDGDGHLDLVWQNDATRELTVWNLGGTQGATFLGWHPLNGSVPGWRVVGIADFNGDGHPDLVWQDDTTRQTTVWYMGGTQGSTFLNWSYLSGSVAGWKVVGVADLNGDGHPDLIWQNDTTRETTVWYMGGTQGATFLGWNSLSGTVAGWRVVGAADFNGDGHLDLVWQNDATRELTVWYMGGAQGATFLDWSPLNGGVAGWKVVGTADFNRDGKPDLIWQNDTTRETTVWYMGDTRGTTFLGWNSLSGNVAGWNVVGPR